MTKHLKAVEKWTMALAAIFMAVGVIFFLGPPAFCGRLGCVLIWLDAYALRRIGQRVFSTFRKPSAVILLFNLKMALLLLLVYLAVRYLHVDPIGFLLGISILPVAIVAVAISHSLKSQHDG